MWLLELPTSTSPAHEKAFYAEAVQLPIETQSPCIGYVQHLADLVPHHREGRMMFRKSVRIDSWDTHGTLALNIAQLAPTISNESAAPKTSVLGWLPCCRVLVMVGLYY